ncbi:acetate--CoA ligase family protein [Noviherbaspirillum sp. Root189]|uniref:acetate--CoA ligase family protein n=1 Tax=Noviherbaspirillum sp. Root189 TaxID=1736487 RepID=UPI000AF85964
MNKRDISTQVAAVTERGSLRPMDLLLNPRSIAFIGASADPSRLGGIAIDHLVKFGFEGKVYPVNPKYQEMHGLQCYPDIESLPEAPDLAVLAIGADMVFPTLVKCHAKGIRAAIIYASGFAEEGEEGARLQQQIADFSREHDMAVCGPNCMGLANLSTGAITAFATIFRDYPPNTGAGHVSLVTQSGNMCAILYVAGYERGIKFNQFINTGNEASIEFAEYLEYLADDPQTHSVIGYLEGLRDGERLIRVSEKFHRAGKALILIKSGETEQGSIAAMSHTASLAGNQAINRAAFRQLGIMQARDPMQLVDVAYLAGMKDRSAGRRIAVASISGAMGGLLTDLLVSAGLEVPVLPQDAQRILKEKAPMLGMVANPIDLTANLYNREGLAAEVFATLVADSNIDTVLVYATGYLLDRIADELIDASRRSGRLFIAIDTGKAKSRDDLERAGIPVFTDVARAVGAMATYLPWREEASRRDHWRALRTEREVATGEKLLLSPRMDEYQTKRLLESHGVPVCAERVARNADEAAAFADMTGFPVALKILSPDIAHKTEAGGVRLHLTNADAVRNAYAEVMDNVRVSQPEAELRGVLVQKMEAGVGELIVGITRDPIFGLSMTVGLGGIFTELFRDVSHRLLPVDETIAHEMLKELRGYKLLTGFRGKPRGDIAAACSAIAAVSTLAMHLDGAINELEINPLLVRAEGDGVVALDALLSTTPVDSNS